MKENRMRKHIAISLAWSVVYLTALWVDNNWLKGIAASGAVISLIGGTILLGLIENMIEENKRLKVENDKT